ncbi:hypothetical protein MKW98_001758, partial [Papaver atlanticum]
MEDKNINQPKIVKQEQVFELLESLLEAVVEKIHKRQRRIQVLKVNKVNNCKSHNTGSGYYKNK